MLLKTIDKVSKNPNDHHYTPHLDTLIIKLNGINQSPKLILEADSIEGFIMFKVHEADGTIGMISKGNPKSIKVEGDIEIFGESYKGCTGCQRKAAKMSKWWLK